MSAIKEQATAVAGLSGVIGGRRVPKDWSRNLGGPTGLNESGKIRANVAGEDIT